MGRGSDFWLFFKLLEVVYLSRFRRFSRYFAFIRLILLLSLHFGVLEVAQSEFSCFFRSDVVEGMISIVFELKFFHFFVIEGGFKVCSDIFCVFFESVFGLFESLVLLLMLFVIVVSVFMPNFVIPRWFIDIDLCDWVLCIWFFLFNAVPNVILFVDFLSMLIDLKLINWFVKGSDLCESFFTLLKGCVLLLVKFLLHFI